MSNLRDGGIAEQPGAYQSSKNGNYFEKHPPELFLIDYKGKINAHIFNFIPTDTTKEFGENGVWTGKLNDWNLDKDTLFVQEIERNVVLKKYLLVSAKVSENLVSKTA